jgi:hypothetical protein
MVDAQSSVTWIFFVGGMVILFWGIANSTEYQIKGVVLLVGLVLAGVGLVLSFDDDW